MSPSQSKLGFNGTWSMAVGGMVGGGIFSTLGVVIEIAGAWAWLSFVVAGLTALAAGYSYVKLAAHYGEGGGAFTFGQYLGHVIDLGPWFPRVAALAILALFIGVNLPGCRSEASRASRSIHAWKPGPR